MIVEFYKRGSAADEEWRTTQTRYTGWYFVFCQKYTSVRIYLVYWSFLLLIAGLKFNINIFSDVQLNYPIHEITMSNFVSFELAIQNSIINSLSIGILESFRKKLYVPLQYVVNRYWIYKSIKYKKSVSRLKIRPISFLVSQILRDKYSHFIFVICV